LRAYDANAAVDKLTLEQLRKEFAGACEALRPLLVLDNFETFAEPEKLHRFLDEVVPFQAKALITSRHRYFRGDFPLPVGAMSETESRSLILEDARARGVMAHFEAPDRVRRVYEAAQGHAYTMRLIVAQVSDRVSVYDACAAVDSNEDVLSALFERSLRLAEPVDAEVASILAALRAECPLEALLLLPLPRKDVEDAVGRLFSLSLLERIDEPLLHHAQYICPRAAGEYIRRKGLLDSPEARTKLERTVQGLRTLTLSMRAAAKKVRGGVKTQTQAADVMMTIAQNAMRNEDYAVARRAVSVALDLAGEDSTIVRHAATLLRKTQSEPSDVDGMFERALGLDPSNADSWLQWGLFKLQMRAPHGQAMMCFERALEADQRSLEAAFEFVGAVLEVLKQEKKLGAGSVRTNDRRAGRALLTKAKSVLDGHLRIQTSAADRARLLGLKGWVVLQLEGVGETLKDIVREAEELAPTSQQIRGLVQTVKRIEAERTGREGD
jgi:Tfp pilus assembly protein PilF